MPAVLRISGDPDILDHLAELAELCGLVVSQAESPPHRFSCCLFHMEEAGYSRSQGNPITALRRMAGAIADEDLGGDGRVEDFHLTVKFGLHTADPADVRQVVAGFHTIPITLGKTSIFAPTESSDWCEVVKVDVHSPALLALNEALATLPYTDNHPEYNPHITLAYVVPGTGQKYADNDLAEGLTCLLHLLAFSDPHRREIVIDLWEDAPFEVRHAPKGGSGKYKGGQFVSKDEAGGGSGDGGGATPESRPAPQEKPKAEPRKSGSIFGRILSSILGKKEAAPQGPAWDEVAPLSVGERMAKSPAYTAFSAKLDKDSQRHYDYLAHTTGRDVEGIKQEAGEKAKKLIDGLSVYSRVKTEGNLMAILDGGFKNQFQTGDSAAVYDPKGRANAENHVIGLPLDTPPAERPMYGYMAPVGYDRHKDGAQNYGSINVKMKDSVKDRSTVSLGDSWEGQSNASWRCEPLTGDISHRVLSAAGLAAQGLDSLNDFDSFQAHWKTYIEAQVQGGIAPEDIESIEFAGQPSEAVVEKLKAMNIPWSTF